MTAFVPQGHGQRIKNVAIMGCSGAIGQALVMAVMARFEAAQVYGFSRTPVAPLVADNHARFQADIMDYEDEADMARAAALASESGPLDLVLVATGLLHQGEIRPEKSLKDLVFEKMMRLYQANCITPSLLAKHFIPHLNKHAPSAFAALSARVGSISDNALGGWYAYRASKAALNMVIKNAAIETARRNKQAIVVGLHPGTVDSPLSQPFQANVPSQQLFTPRDAACYLLDVLSQLTPAQSGKCFAWDGQEIAP